MPLSSLFNYVAKNMWINMIAQKLARNKQAVILGCVTGFVMWALVGLHDVQNVNFESWEVGSRDSMYTRKLQLNRQVMSGETRQGVNLVATTHVGGRCVKKIMIFGDMSEMRNWPELRAIEGIFREEGGLWEGAVHCPAHGCNISLTLSNDVSLMVGMDAVIIGMLPKVLETHLPALLRTNPAEGQTWIYFSTETPFRVTVWSKTHTLRQLQYHKMMTYRRDADIYLPFGNFRNYLPGENKIMSKTRDYAAGKTDLIVWIASNCGEVTWPRIPFMERLQELLPVKAYGHCGNLTCLPERSERCNLIMRKFKFYLALANSECRDYITEKFWANSLGYNIVPVVYGAPRADFEAIAPPDSFIHVSDFPSLEALAEYIRFLDQDDSLYNAYFDWKKHGLVQQSFPITKDTICRVVPHIYNGTEQKVHTIRESEWYNGCRKPISSIFGFAKERQYAQYSAWAPWELESR
ncbi:alpha-(1,3)-fucosyltransferase 7-like [Asterias amurensis]|uniref:alpha-(1,3)-fucosyltransferase 7-like n=1 Tax=Asterias amurensis TaxID=7602 RepID=UPI003AB4AB70